MKHCISLSISDINILLKNNIDCDIKIKYGSSYVNHKNVLCVVTVHTEQEEELLFSLATKPNQLSSEGLTSYFK